MPLALVLSMPAKFTLKTTGPVVHFTKNSA